MHLSHASCVKEPSHFSAFQSSDTTSQSRGQIIIGCRRCALAVLSRMSMLQPLSNFSSVLRLPMLEFSSKCELWSLLYHCWVRAMCLHLSQSTFLGNGPCFPQIAVVTGPMGGHAMKALQSVQDGPRLTQNAAIRA